MKASPKLPSQLDGVGIDPKLGAQLSIDSISLLDESGQTVKLSNYFKEKPVILFFNYSRCHTLCSFVLMGVVATLKNLPWHTGAEFTVLTVSMDIRDSFKDAARKKEEIMKEYGRKGAETGWHFLVGDQANILKLTGEVGFKFKYDEANKEFAHGSGIFILTPKGKISRFFPGIQYPARNVKFSLMEAASNKIGTVVERLILYCYRYDDHAKGYVVYVQNLMRVAGLLTGVGLFGYLGLFWWGERKRQHEKGNMSICS